MRHLPVHALSLFGSLLSTAAAPAQVAPRAPAALFAASCATCHGQDGLGGHPSWVDPARITPRLARGLQTPSPVLESRYRFAIRNGSWYGPGFMQAMPAFGREVLTDAELNALIPWLLYAPPAGGSSMATGVGPPPPPPGRAVVLEILDEAPWFRDDGTDLADPSGDRRRVVLSPGEYVQVVNRGRTWHTVSNPALGVDTGFIGWSGNLPLQQTGYAYLDPASLPAGAHAYWCSMHPYMQVEIVTPGSVPAGLTQVQRLPLPPPAVTGDGEVWVGLQTWPNPGAPNGAVEVVDATRWTSTLIPAVGNNPHNGWLGTARDAQGRLRNVAVFANWHDATVTVVDADRKAVLGDVRLGAANAHVMTAPGRRHPVTGADRWFVTVMGSNKVQELEPFAALAAGTATLPAISQSNGEQGRPAFSPHGLWFLDDGVHFVTANTYPGSASLYSTTQPWADGSGRTGTGCELASAPSGGALPLAASVFGRAAGPGGGVVAYTNNAGSDDISVYRIDTTPGAQAITRVPVPPPLGNAAGNLALRDTALTPVRWVHMPIQCAVSPPDATLHRRFMVVCNKTSMNVSIVALGADGLPTGVYTFAAGLGCHGVTFGRKRTGATAGDERKVAYLAYVTNTFADYVSVYDLELLEQLLLLEAQGRAPAAFRPGGATEQVLVSGAAPLAMLGLPSVVVPLVVFSPDARGLVHVGDVPLSLPAQPGPRCYLQTHVWIDVPGLGMTDLDLDLGTNTGAMGIVATPLPPPWGR